MRHSFAKGNLPFIRLVSSLLFLFGLLFTIQNTTAQQLSDSLDVPKNIILLIGDGMSYPQISATELHIGSLNMTSMPSKGMISTFSKDQKITDSAAAATALATGYKTNNGMLSILPDGTELKSINRFASEIGKSTGLITSSRITHATPAAFAVNHDSRRDEFEIAEKFVHSDIDMILGGGSNYFLPQNEGGLRTDNRNLIDEMIRLGYTFIQDIDDLDNHDNKEKVIGLFVPKDFQRYPERGNVKLEMTLSALEQLSKDPDGFFLMIEGAQIDWAGHDKNLSWLISEMTDFDAVIGAVLEFANRDGNTLVVVTADHETGGLTLNRGRLWNRNRIQFEFSTANHTALHVPVFSFGPSSENFNGYFDNTEIAQKFFYLWGKDKTSHLFSNP
ncbi:MAG: alkaline phosphatase [Balneolaceae bacterium]|nr:alkaline phosphatase [Balneolaceae bacterium]